MQLGPEGEMTPEVPSGAELVIWLAKVLGGNLLAYITEQPDTVTVGRWARGEVQVPPDVENRLAATRSIVDLLLTKESPATIQAWFMGMDPFLDDEAPARVLRSGAKNLVRQAAMSFLANG